MAFIVIDGKEKGMAYIPAYAYGRIFDYMKEIGYSEAEAEAVAEWAERSRVFQKYELAGAEIRIVV